jgi:hypothetical protein
MALHRHSAGFYIRWPAGLFERDTGEPNLCRCGARAVASSKRPARSTPKPISLDGGFMTPATPHGAISRAGFSLRSAGYSLSDRGDRFLLRGQARIAAENAVAQWRERPQRVPTTSLEQLLERVAAAEDAIGALKQSGVPSTGRERGGRSPRRRGDLIEISSTRSRCGIVPRNEVGTGTAARLGEQGR